GRRWTAIAGTRRSNKVGGVQPAPYLFAALLTCRTERCRIDKMRRKDVFRTQIYLTRSFIPTSVHSQKGFQHMAVTRHEERSASRIWGIGVRQVVFMALGAALYGGLSYLTNVLQLPATSNVSFRPAIVIPLFFGVVFGPWVGLFTGGVGNFLGDYISGYGVYWNWDVGNALIGFIAGLALYMTWGRYNNTRNIIIAEMFSAIGIVVGIGFAVYIDFWVLQFTIVFATGIFVSDILYFLV